MPTPVPLERRNVKVVSVFQSGIGAILSGIVRILATKTIVVSNMRIIILNNCIYHYQNVNVSLWSEILP